MLTLFAEMILAVVCFAGGFYTHMKFGAKFQAAATAVTTAAQDIKKI